MKMTKVYVTLDEFSNYIKSKLPPEELEGIEDCTFVPLKIGLQKDLTIEALCVAAKNGTTNKDIRYNVWRGV